jgi:predicted urease superfamily metal-dependent hydrolase
MDEALRERRENVRQTIDQRANELREGGMHPFEVQNLRSAANQELAMAVPDTEKYQQAVNLASQYAQKGAV